MSGTGVKDQMLDPKLLLASLLLRKLQRFERVWLGARDEDQNIYIYFNDFTVSQEV